VHILCLPHLPLPDQEVDDFAVAQSTPLPECIAGFEGDAVRSPPFSIAVFSLSSPKPSPLCKPTPSPRVQGGETYAKGFGISILIPKNFRHESFEAEETAKELTIKAAKATAAKAKAEAMDEANKAEAKAKKSAAVKQAGSKQKIKKQAATEKQKAAAAPAKEDAPVKRSTVSFPGTRVVFVIAALFFAVTMALRSNSSTPTGAAEVVTPKSIFSWANDQQCGLYDNNDSCAAQEAFETTCSVRL
jgi:hypothetical protein